MRHRLLELHRDESGHAEPAMADLLAVVGAVLLAAGAATGEDVITIVGGVGLGLGIFVSGLLNHIRVDYDIFERLNRLEEKNADGDD